MNKIYIKKEVIWDISEFSLNLLD